VVVAGFRRDAGIGVKKAPPISAAIFVLLVAAALSMNFDAKCNPPALSAYSIFASPAGKSAFELRSAQDGSRVGAPREDRKARVRASVPAFSGNESTQSRRESNYD